MKQCICAPIEKFVYEPLKILCRTYVKIYDILLIICLTNIYIRVKNINYSVHA